jgi:hypothetical protein
LSAFCLFEVYLPFDAGRVSRKEGMLQRPCAAFWPCVIGEGENPEKIVRSDTPSAQAIDVPGVETTEILAALGAVIHVGFQAEITLAL